MQQNTLFLVLCGLSILPSSEQQQQYLRERIVIDPGQSGGSKVYYGDVDDRRVVNRVFGIVPHELEEQLIIYLDLYDIIGIKEGVFYAKDKNKSAVNANGVQFTFRKLKEDDFRHWDNVVVIIENRTVAQEIANKIKRRQ